MQTENLQSTQDSKTTKENTKNTAPNQNDTQESTKQDNIKISMEVIKFKDDKNILDLSQKDDSLLTFAAASETKDFFRVWEETYNKQSYDSNIIFNSMPYQIGIKPLLKKDLKPFDKVDRITTAFREILRHNNISDRENAFNKLLSLFLCKCVDEQSKKDDEELDFQYKSFSDTYFSLYERIFKLYIKGMNDFLKEEVYKTEDNFVKNTIQTYIGKNRERMQKELEEELLKATLFSSNAFSFKETHNKDLFKQNGKILVEVVELLSPYKVSYSSKEQLLGELFEKLLNEGFKEDEGRYFTPVPITRFIWNSLPFEDFINLESASFPKVLDFACGAGHFLTEGVSAISDYCKSQNKQINDEQISQNFYGIDKDNRLARTTQVAMLLNGANGAKIRSIDGLEYNNDFYGDTQQIFDILVSNPPYSVKDFRQHLSKNVLKGNDKFIKYQVLDYISLNSKAIENVFVERLTHILKPNALASIILPSSILSNTDLATIKTREILLANFAIYAIVSFGNQTFGTTGTNTIVLFLKRFEEPPKKIKLLQDSLDAIFSQKDEKDLEGFEDKAIFESYLELQNIPKEIYQCFLDLDSKCLENEYFTMLYKEFETSSELQKLESQKSFNALPKEEQGKQKSEKFFEFARKLEREKLEFFALTYKQKTLIVNAPSDNNEQKKFLGYTISQAKGRHGLVETGGLLSDRDNRNAEDTIAFAIKSTFRGKMLQTQRLEKYLIYTQTCFLLSFDLATFSKAINLNPEYYYDPTQIDNSSCHSETSPSCHSEGVQSTTEESQNFSCHSEGDKPEESHFLDSRRDVSLALQAQHDKGDDCHSEEARSATEESLNSIRPLKILRKTSNASSPFVNCKYELVRLESICKMYQPKTITSKEILDKGKYKVYGANGVIGFYDDFNHKDSEVAMTCRGATCGTLNYTEPESWITGNAMIITPLNNLEVLKKFLFYILPLANIKNVITGSAQPQITRANLSQLKIPLPPLEIQKQIVRECEKVEWQYKLIKACIESYQTLIKAILSKCKITESSDLQTLIDSTLALVATCQTEASSCHSEALAEESQPSYYHSEHSEESLKDSNRDVSASPQHDKGDDCHFEGDKPEESHSLDSNRDSSLVSQAQNDNSTSPSQHEGDTSYTSPLPMRRGLGGGYPKITTLESKDKTQDSTPPQPTHVREELGSSRHFKTSPSRHVLGVQSTTEESPKPQNIEELIALILAHINELESRLDWDLIASCHSEGDKPEESLKDSNRDVSLALQAQHDNLTSHSEIPSHCHSEDFEIEESRYYNTADTEELNKLLESLPTPPPNGWEKVRISQIAEKLTAGGDKPKIFSETKTQECKIPIYANAVQNEGLYGWTNQATILKNSLTVSARGTIGYAVARFEPFYPIVRLIVLIPKKELVNLKFLESLINNTTIENSGVNIPQLTVPEFSSLQIPLPPLEAQQKIVSVIEDIESKISSIDSSLESLEKEKTKILNRTLNNDKRERETRRRLN
ncbi:restriction endonuclease subunit S [Helicobacter aurati]|uniref:restriction endonuclease subunit S n=1 Tax=Helicobacter aurati TaxID=137778 RepID=UPI00131533D0|nr:restriction endonuclease subunit S [Helicobacter aurati]